MKKAFFLFCSLILIGTSFGQTKDIKTKKKLVKQKIINFNDTLHIPVQIKEDKTLIDANKQQPALNQVTDIYVTDYLMPRVDLAPYTTRSFTLDFDHHDPNGQYTILTVTLATLSGNGSAEIMQSLTPIVNGYTTLYLHNPHPFERGETMNMRFVIYFRKNL